LAFLVQGTSGWYAKRLRVRREENPPRKKRDDRLFSAQAGEGGRLLSRGEE